jgi:biotin carboxyl carrier protein
MAQSQEAQKTGPTDAEQALRTKQDHAAIGRLADDLLPTLIAKLAASGLGEIEVRQGGWKARLRKPATVAEPHKAPVAETAVHARAAAHGRADERERRIRDAQEADQGKVVATSPAVGIYSPRRDLAIGMRVRSGDKIGTVDVLGVKQDVVSPVDGIIGSSLAETGEAVEYGQELVRIELPETAPAGEAPAGEAPAGEVPAGEVPAGGAPAGGAPTNAATGASAAGAQTVAVAGKA